MGGFFLSFHLQVKHDIQKVDAGLGAEKGFSGRTGGFLILLAFVLIDQIISLQQDAVVDALDGIVGMMMADQPADALDICGMV